jgi:8-oxo-dGTP diphosphatase
MSATESYLHWLRARVGHELIPLTYSTAIVRNAQGDILLQYRSDFHSWGLPGGVLEPGESPASCAVRETLEETGLMIRPLRLAAVLSGPEHSVEYPNGDLSQQISAYLDCDVLGGALECSDPETSDVAFFAPTALPDMFPWYRLAIRSSIESSNTTYFDPPVFSAANAHPNPIWRHLRSRVGPDPLVLPGAMALIRDAEDRILMLRRTDTGKWWLPGGLLELGESLAATAVREVKEETGLEIEPFRLAGIFAGYQAQFASSDKLFPFSAWFDCRIVGGLLVPDHVEADRAEYFPMDNLPEIPAGLAERIHLVNTSPHQAVFV